MRDQLNARRRALGRRIGVRAFKRTMTAACAGAALLAPGLAVAADGSGPYLRGELAAALLQDARLTDVNPASPNAVLGEGNAVHLDTAGALSIGFGLGYQLMPGLRLELSANNRGKFALDGRSTNLGTPVEADLSAMTGEVHLYVDVVDLIQPGGLGIVHPYVGFGAGFSWLSLKDITARPTPGELTLPEGKARARTWAVSLGSGVELTDSLMLDIGYRYMDMGFLETRGGDISVRTSMGTITAASDPIRISPEIHEAYVGLRWRF